MKMTFFSVILLGSFLARADYFPEISPGSTAPMTASKTLATFMGTVKQAVKRSMGKGCPDQVDKICAGDIVVIGERNHSLSQELSLAIVDRIDGLNFINVTNAQLTYLISSRHTPATVSLPKADIGILGKLTQSSMDWLKKNKQPIFVNNEQFRPALALQMRNEQTLYLVGVQIQRKSNLLLHREESVKIVSPRYIEVCRSCASFEY